MTRVDFVRQPERGGGAWQAMARVFQANSLVNKGIDVNVRDAIVRSGILQSFPTIDLETQKVGVFGRLVKPDTALRPGDRVEIYRSITCDPQTVPRRDSWRDDDE